MIKASAGGGGKGMRIAWNDDETKWDILSVFNYMQIFYIIITCIRPNLSIQTPLYYRQFVLSQKDQKSYIFYLYNIHLCKADT